MKGHCMRKKILNLFWLPVMLLILSCGLGCRFQQKPTRFEEMIAAENVFSEADFRRSDFWNDLCVFISHIYKKYSNYYLIGDEKVWENASNMIMDLLMVYFNSSESSSRDTNELMPFLQSGVSEDGFLRVHSWYLDGGGVFLLNNSIVQYIFNENQVKAVSMDDFIDSSKYEFDKNLGFGVVFTLTDDWYLIFGGTGSSLAMTYAVVAVKMERDSNNSVNLVPLPVFNNSNFFMINEYWGRQFPRKMVIRESDFNRENVSFTITYDEVIDDSIEILPDNENENLRFHTLEFSFDGTEFIGDYDRLNEVINSYLIQ